MGAKTDFGSDEFRPPCGGGNPFGRGIHSVTDRGYRNVLPLFNQIK